MEVVVCMQRWRWLRALHLADGVAFGAGRGPAPVRGVVRATVVLRLCSSFWGDKDNSKEGRMRKHLHR